MTSSPYPACRRPPPCPNECWEWIGRGPSGDLAWRYVQSISRCGHTWNQHEGRWTWKQSDATANTPPPIGRRPTTDTGHRRRRRNPATARGTVLA